jgi:Cu2+-exporting ATPase
MVQIEQVENRPLVSPPPDDPGAYVIVDDQGEASLHLIVENIHCPGCIHTIESLLHNIDGVHKARVNLSTKRLAVSWDDKKTSGHKIVSALSARDYQVVPFDPVMFGQLAQAEDKKLLWALVVAGFAAINVMILSVAVWSGFAGDMGPATRSLLHWISALIALPAVAYSGQPFFRSALSALRNRSLNMDVPISLAVILAAGMSLAETIRGAEDVFFDAAVMLLFFLLIGRYLDRRARTRASEVAQNLLSLRAVAATVIEGDGSRRSVAIENLWPGMRVAIAAGERIPADGVIEAGHGDIDTSLITGESLPQAAKAGQQVYSGAMLSNGGLEVRVSAAGDDTLLAEIVRLMEAAEQSRARYVRLADRAAAIYAPAVHGLSVLTFLGWLMLGEIGWQASLMNAIAVLIITCPCALGLAVPAVQVVASGILLRMGVLVKVADGLERLAEIDTVVFDKTGTLTNGKPILANRGEQSGEDLALAASISAGSRHPLAEALVAASNPVLAAHDIVEIPGMGLEAQIDGKKVRLGNREWCGIDDAAYGDGCSELWLVREDGKPVRFAFRDQPKADASKAIQKLLRKGLQVHLLSGDRSLAVELLAKDMGIANWTAQAKPDEKVKVLEALHASGRKVLMVGDGLNDAPALRAAYVSAAFARGSDVSQASADFIFQNPRLRSLPWAYAVACMARNLILQNFGFALIYNLIAVPLAMAGLVSPLIAAVAMSASSIVVTLNALRLRCLKSGNA